MKRIRNIERDRLYSKDWYKKNKEYHRDYLRKQRFELRYSLIQEFGPVCSRCGFSDARALQFDHVNDDGYLEASRKEGHHRHRGYSFSPKKYRELREQFLDKKLQILCANCNWIKCYEYRIKNIGEV